MTNTQPIRVIVADGRPLVRDLLGEGIARDHRFEVYAADGTLEGVLAALREPGADVVLFSADAVDVPVDWFVQSVSLVSATAPVVVLAPDKEHACVYAALEAGAAGFAAPDTKLEELKGRLLAAAASQTVLPTGFVMQILDRARAARYECPKRYSVPGLTSREHEILALLTEGHANAEIASRLGVSTNTVKNHLYSIYRKLGVRSRSQAFATVAKMGVAV